MSEKVSAVEVKRVENEADLSPSEPGNSRNESKALNQSASSRQTPENEKSDENKIICQHCKQCISPEKHETSDKCRFKLDSFDDERRENKKEEAARLKSMELLGNLFASDIKNVRPLDGGNRDSKNLERTESKESSNLGKMKCGIRKFSSKEYLEYLLEKTPVKEGGQINEGIEEMPDKKESASEQNTVSEREDKQRIVNSGKPEKKHLTSEIPKGPSEKREEVKLTERRPKTEADRMLESMELLGKFVSSDFTKLGNLEDPNDDTKKKSVKCKTSEVSKVKSDEQKEECSFSRDREEKNEFGERLKGMEFLSKVAKNQAKKYNSIEILEEGLKEDSSSKQTPKKDVPDGIKLIGTYDFPVSHKVKLSQRLKEVKDNSEMEKPQRTENPNEDLDGSVIRPLLLVCSKKEGKGSEDLETMKKHLEREFEFVIPPDKILLRFLRVTNFQVMIAVERCLGYYKMKKEYENEFGGPVNPNEMIPIYSIVCLLPKPDTDGSRIFYMECNNWNISRISIEDVFKASVLCVEKALEEEASQLPGMIFLINAKGFGLKHSSVVTQPMVQKVVRGVQTLMPMRIKNVFIVNETPFFKSVYKKAQPYVHERLRERICFFGTDYGKLRLQIKPTNLPTSAGGELEFDNNHFIQEMALWQNTWFEYNQYGFKQ